MGKTLYDLLEISQEASAEAVRASFERLVDKEGLNPGPDSEIRVKALHEAFLTLGAPAKRAAYDEDLKRRMGVKRPEAIQYEVVEPFWTRTRAFVMIAVLLAGGGYYYKSQKDAQIEADRLAVERKRLEVEALEKKAEMERIQAERADAARAAALEGQQRMERDRAVYAADESFRRSMSEEQYRRTRESAEARNRDREADYRQNRDYQEALRRAERDKAEARRIDAERTYGGNKVTVIGR